jgi:hypothetical protein
MPFSSVVRGFTAPLDHLPTWSLIDSRRQVLWSSGASTNRGLPSTDRRAERPETIQTGQPAPSDARAATARRHSKRKQRRQDGYPRSGTTQLLPEREAGLMPYGKSGRQCQFSFPRAGITAAFSRSQPVDSQLRRTSSRFCWKALFAVFRFFSSHLLRRSTSTLLPWRFPFGTRRHHVLFQDSIDHIHKKGWQQREQEGSANEHTDKRRCLGARGQVCVRRDSHGHSKRSGPTLRRIEECCHGP